MNSSNSFLEIVTTIINYKLQLIQHLERAKKLVGGQINILHETETRSEDDETVPS